MARPADPYSRLYWRLIDDEQFAAIYGDDHHFALWCRLLLAADMAWPASASLPYRVRKSSLRALSDAGLVIVLNGNRYKLRGLDAERGRRQAKARKAAEARWDADGDEGDDGPDADMPPPERGNGPMGTPGAMQEHSSGQSSPDATGSANGMQAHPSSSAQSMPSRAEPSRAKPSRAEKRRDSGHVGPLGPDSARATPGGVHARLTTDGSDGEDRQGRIDRARRALADPATSPARREAAIGELNRLGAPA